MCGLVLNKTINYYTLHSGHLFCTMLDATKALDRIEYCKLFRCQLKRQLPYIVIRLLMNLYTNHVTRVMWNGVQSRWFGVLNGVKQGGVLSPILCCVYIYGLLYT